MSSRQRLARRLRYLALLALPGAVANALAMTAPGSVPLLAGLGAAYAVALRLPLHWALLAAILVGAATGQLIWTAVAVSSAAAVWAARRFGLSVGAGFLLSLAPSLLLVCAWAVRGDAGGALALQSTVLLLGHLIAWLGARMINGVALSPDRRAHAGLASQLSARIGVLLATPLFLIFLASGQFAWQSRKASVQAALDAYSEGLAADVSGFLDARLRVIAFAADDTRLPGHAPALADLAERFPEFITLLVTDAHGTIVEFHAPQHAQFVGNVSDRDYFRAPRESDAPFASGVFQGRGFGTDMLIAVSAPHYDGQGEFAGVVQASVSLDELSTRLHAREPASGLEFALRDADHQLIAGTLAPADGLSPVRPAAATSTAENDWTRSRHIVPSGWRLSVQQDVAPLQRDAQLTSLSVGALILLLIGLVLRFVPGFVAPLTRPLSELIGRMRDVDLDRAATLSPQATLAPHAEYRQLQIEFDAMLARIAGLHSELRSALLRGEALNTELEQRVAFRTAELARALERANALADARSAFLATMSHELRTPLTAILGFAESALRSPLSLESAHQALCTIDRNGRHLLGIVNDILDAGRLESGQLALALTDAAPWDIAESVYGLFTEQAQRAGLDYQLKIDWPLPRSIRVDLQRIRQALMNLLGNAMKFTRQGGVTLHVLGEPPGRLVFEVSDTGIGIRDEDRNRLFAAFSQADPSPSRRFGGSGLGLHISRALVQMMGGSIEFDSKVGIGSRFRVVLSVDPDTSWIDVAEATLTPPTGLAPPRLSGKVLVADDVADLRWLLKALVEETGAEVRLASDGAEALSLALSEPPDLMLLDMHMPEMDGADVARKVREVGLSTPIIAITADVLPDSVRRFKQAGCNEVLGKPIDRTHLYRLLAHVLRPAQPEGEEARSESPAAAPAGAGSARISSLISRSRQRFAETLLGDLEWLQSTQPPDDPAPIRRRLHTLKGSAATFGLAELGRAAAVAERALLEEGSDWHAARESLLALCQVAIRASTVEHSNERASNAD